jgi:hypothetical protein
VNAVVSNEITPYRAQRTTCTRIHQERASMHESVQKPVWCHTVTRFHRRRYRQHIPCERQTHHRRAEIRCTKSMYILVRGSACRSGRLKGSIGKSHSRCAYSLLIVSVILQAAVRGWPAKSGRRVTTTYRSIDRWSSGCMVQGIARWASCTLSMLIRY